jgi:hypothetical protein
MSRNDFSESNGLELAGTFWCQKYEEKIGTGSGTRYSPRRIPLHWRLVYTHISPETTREKPRQPRDSISPESLREPINHAKKTPV